ncbi:hypothetical protein Nmel_000158 [Mimus melanotis]
MEHSVLPALLHFCISFFPPDVLTSMHESYSLTVVLRLGDAFVTGGCFASWEVPKKQGSWEERSQHHVHLGQPDDYCPKASSWGCVGAKSGLHVGEDILDLFRTGVSDRHQETLNHLVFSVTPSAFALEGK